MMRLCAACRNTSVSRTTGTAPDADDVGQHLTGSDRRKLVDVANDQQRGLVRHRLHQRLHQHDVDHGGLVDDQQVAVERVVVAALEAAALGVDLQQPVNGLGLEPGCLGHALGGAAGRRAEQEPHALRRENAQNGFDDGGLAHARSAGDDQHLGRQGEPDRGNLAFGKRQARSFCSTHGNALSGSMKGQGSVPFASRSSRSAMACSAR